MIRIKEITPRIISSNIIRTKIIPETNEILLSPIDVDLFYSGEFGNTGDTLTPFNLKNGTHATWDVLWDFSANGATYMKIESSNAGLLRRVRVNNTIYSNGGTRGFSFPLFYSVCNTAVALPTGKDSLSIGFWFTYGGDNGSFDTIDYVNFYTNDGGYFILQSFNNDIRAHGDLDGSSQIGSNIPIIPGDSYWITMKYVKNSICTLMCYNSDGTLRGSSFVDLDSNGLCTGIQFGRLDNHTINTVDTYGIIDNIIIDFTNVRFPLGV